MAYNGGLNSKIHSSSSRAIHRVVELRRSHDALSTVVVSRRGSIGPATRHRVVAPRCSQAAAAAIACSLRATAAARHSGSTATAALLEPLLLASVLVDRAAARSRRHSRATSSAASPQPPPRSPPSRASWFVAAATMPCSLRRSLRWPVAASRLERKPPNTQGKESNTPEMEVKRYPEPNMHTVVVFTGKEMGKNGPPVSVADNLDPSPHGCQSSSGDRLIEKSKAFHLKSDMRFKI
ncbi:hypothetical protein Scep_030281 [Stephania cephalantha]|uniref:Uncharacterized protein n=1 Tax=Stephania cephalantha TaxID=152367 RepID=A0AAP0E260_9MAGN